MIYPNKLLNLWDMLKEYSAISSWLISGISQREMILSAHLINEQSRLFSNFMTFRRLKISQEDADFIKTYLPYAERLAADLDLHLTDIAVKRISMQLEQGGYRKHDLADDLKDLRQRLQDELKSRQFVYVDPGYAEFYKKSDLFGQEVNDSFPEAMDDIQDAGTLLALGMSTSCVMHLMRVVEVGLKTLANELDVPYSVNWGDYLRKIEKNISTKSSLKSPEWEEKEVFYRDLSGDLMTIKQAWRNPAMHLDRRFSTDEAELIFVAVKSFMQRIAHNLKSNAQPVLKLVKDDINISNS
jgi:hypothetical protein